MSNLTLHLLRSRGIITGPVLPFGRHSNARSYIERSTGKRLIKVPEAKNCGAYWAMSDEDARRMLACGYEEDDVTRASEKF